MPVLGSNERSWARASLLPSATKDWQRAARYQLRKGYMTKRDLAMRGQSFYFRLLAKAFVLLSIGSHPVMGAAHQDANSTNGLNSVASFDFKNIKKFGENTNLHGVKSAIADNITTVDSPFGCAAEFDGKSRISVNTDNVLNFNHSFSATAWVDGIGAQFRTLEWAGMRSPNFQVVGDKIYFVTNSDPPLDSSHSSSKKETHYYRSVIWSGVADANLASMEDQRRTKLPLSGLEAKLQVVGDRLFFEYFGNDTDGNWQIYTGTSGIDGKGWRSTQRTFTRSGYDVEQARNIQVVGDKVYYAFPMKDKNGKWQLWTATSNLDSSSWKARQETTSGGFIPSFQVSGDKIYYIYLSGTENDKVTGYLKNDVIIASSNLDGSGWHEIRRIHGGAWVIAQLTVDKGTIYYSFSRLDSGGNSHLWTGSVSTNGSSPQEMQRTFGTGDAPAAAVQVVGDKVMYSFSSTKNPSMMDPGPHNTSFWIASTNLNGAHWKQQRIIGGNDSEDDYQTGYKMLDVVGGKSYYDLMRLHYVNGRENVVMHENSILAYSGSNILNKGDSYGIGMSASGSVSGFVNAGQDYLYRGEAPEDTAGALVEQQVASGWHHVAVTYDGSILRLYVDGKLSRETRYDKKPAANPFPLSIGDGFVGKIARLKLFDRALGQSEISVLADRHNQTPCSPTQY